MTTQKSWIRMTNLLILINKFLQIRVATAEYRSTAPSTLRRFCLFFVPAPREGNYARRVSVFHQEAQRRISTNVYYQRIVVASPLYKNERKNEATIQNTLSSFQDYWRSRDVGYPFASKQIDRNANKPLADATYRWQLRGGRARIDLLRHSSRNIPRNW